MNRISAWLGAATLAWACTASAAGIAPIPAGAPGGGVLDVPAIRVADPARVLLDCAALAGDRVVAGGEHGVIALSDDDGTTWRQAQTPVSATITALSFADGRTGYATGHFGVILRTDDAGEHWRIVLDGRAVPALMQAAAGDDARALRTAARMEQDGPDKPFLLARVLSPDRVSAFGASGIAVETADGGAHWRDVSRTIENPESLNLYGLVERPDGAVLLVGEQGLLLAGDPSRGLRRLASPNAGSFFGVASLPGGRLLAFGLVGHAFLSATGGADWSEVTVERPVTLTAAVVRADGAVLVGDAQGQVWRFDAAADGKLASLAPSGGRVPYPVAALCETRSGKVLAFGLGGAWPLDGAARE